MGRRHVDRVAKARIVERLADRDLSVRQIADLTGIPKSTVHRLLNPPEVSQMGQSTPEERRDDSRSKLAGMEPDEAREAVRELAALELVDVYDRGVIDNAQPFTIPADEEDAWLQLVLIEEVLDRYLWAFCDTLAQIDEDRLPEAAEQHNGGRPLWA